MNPEQHVRFRAYRLRAYGLFLAAAVIELAFPIGLFATPSPSCTGNCTVGSATLGSPVSGLVLGLVILWNGLAISLGLLGWSAFLLSKSVLLEARWPGLQTNRSSA